MNYLVTGAAGFIGSRIAAMLLGHGHNVTIIDNLSSGFQRNIPAGAEFINADCREPKTWESLGERKFDRILHLAGQSSGEISFDNPVFDLDSNTRATLLLLDWASRVGCKSIVFASTMGVYGDKPDEPTEETATPVPKSFYSATKLFCEHYLRLYAMHKGVSATALRLFTVYGPGQDMDNFRQGMVSIYMGLAMKHGSIHVKGSLDRYRDFVYVDDVARAFISAAEANLNGFNFFNVCTGKKTTVGMLLSDIRGLFANDVPMKVEGTTPGDQFGLYGHNGKIFRGLDWRPQVELKDGLSTMKDWVEKHRSYFNL